MTILSIHTDGGWHLILSSCPLHVSLNSKVGHSFDEQGLYTVDQLSAPEMAVDQISIVTLLLMSFKGDGTPLKTPAQAAVENCRVVGSHSFKADLGPFSPFSIYSKRLAVRNIVVWHAA